MVCSPARSLRTSATHPCATNVAVCGGTPRTLSAGSSTVRCGEVRSNRAAICSTGSPPSTAMSDDTKNSPAAGARVDEALDQPRFARAVDDHHGGSLRHAEVLHELAVALHRIHVI